MASETAEASTETTEKLSKEGASPSPLPSNTQDTQEGVGVGGGSGESNTSRSIVPKVELSKEINETMSGETSHAAYFLASADDGTLVQRSEPPMSTNADIPPFNPMQNSTHVGVTNDNAINSSIGSSVVRDLMRVYENLTQSSTPHQGRNENIQEPDSGGETQPHYQEQLPGSAPSGGYGIPPPTYHAASSKDQAGNYAPPEQGHNNSYDPAYVSQFEPPASESPPAEGDQKGPPAAPSSVKSDDQDDDADAACDESDEQASYSGGRTSSRRKRRGSHDTSISTGGSAGRSGSTKSKKKSKKQDGRWSKRFTWPEDLHRDFVSAIFDVGLKHSSPSTILEQMPRHEQITTERIKSHLQKYRLHRIKSKKEFIASYEASMRNFSNSPDMGNNGQIVSGAGVAAHLAYTALADSENSSKEGKGGDNDEQIAQPNAGPMSADSVSKEDIGSDVQMICATMDDQLTLSNSQLQPQAKNDSLILPQLTEAEKQSPIGAAMGYLMGLFFSLKQQLLIQRSLEAGSVGAKSNVPLQDIFSSFVSGAVPAAGAVGVDFSTDGNLNPQVSIAMTGGSVRTTIEENTMMKREMQNQMALQNKMRTLKQQELAKYKHVASSAPSTTTGAVHKGSIDGGIGLPSSQPNREEEFAIQGAGETAGNDGSAEYHRGGGNARPHSLSFGVSEEFWNTDVVDEQLFEFLMNN